MNCEKVFDYLVGAIKDYLTENPSLKTMVLGVSGGIDSTICAALCHEASLLTGTPLVGRSITMCNTKDEVSSSKLVGKAFCDDFKEVSLLYTYNHILEEFGQCEPEMEKLTTDISRGNIQARLRMIYLYNIAGVRKGLVIDTDNLTEHNLGFFTIHGDVGDFNPIGGLWKTEIYELAKWLVEVKYKDDPDKANAIAASAKLLPTDGLGISKSDYDQIGATMENTDGILQTVMYMGSGDSSEEIIKQFDKYRELDRPNNVENVLNRMKATMFKRKKLPIVVHTSVEGLGTMEAVNIF